MTKDPPSSVEEYLRCTTGPAPQAYQFTLNGLTYPFVRHDNFAAVLDPPPTTTPAGLGRRMSHLTNLYCVKPGDLMFFFQADPQPSGSALTERKRKRGIVGVYRVVDGPFRGLDVFERNGFKIQGQCETCDTPFAWAKNREGPSGSGISDCYCWGSTLPGISNHKNIAQMAGSSLTLSARLEIEPVFLFDFPVGDNVVYNFEGDSGSIVTGSVDNAMGAGKGSTIRHLLPEEAVKLTRLLMRINSDSWSAPNRIHYAGKKHTIAHEDGVPVAGHYPAWDDGRVRNEMFLNLYASEVARSKSNLSDVLDDIYKPNKVEFFCSELPWGYTNDEADFVLALSEGGKRVRIILMEFKTVSVDSKAAVQLMVYVPWVAQMLGQWCSPEVNSIKVVPVLIGRRAHRRLALPSGWEYSVLLNNRRQIQVEVAECRMLSYEVVGIAELGDCDRLYGTDIEFAEEELPRRTWKPRIDIQRQDISWLLGKWEQQSQRSILDDL